MSKETSWGSVSDWYHGLLGKEGTYQAEVILPNIIRLLDFKDGETILDLACGEGFFIRKYAENTEKAKQKLKFLGVDIAPELIKIAKENFAKIFPANKSAEKSVEFHVSQADKLPFIKDNSVDKITIILAIQNIDNIQEVFKECNRVLKKEGKLYLVLNHPAFRIPKKSSWEFDETKKIQYRRIDGYLSESREEIDMEPGKTNAKTNGKKTISFHRPLQVYFKSLVKAGFAIHRLEEWTSHKMSEKGPRQDAENTARKEIPLFLMLEGRKILEA